MYLAVRHFRSMLEGRPFTAFVDHKPLTFAMIDAGQQVISWANMLPWVLLGLCTTPKDGLWASSAEMVYGQTLRVPGDLFPDSTIPWSAVSQRADFEDKAGILLLSPPPGTGCLALMLSLIYRRQTMSLCGKMHIGGRCGGRMMALLVFWSRGRRIFLLTLGPGQGVSMHHLKPAHLDLDRPVELALPPRRGCPPTRASGLGKLQPSPPLPVDLPSTGASARRTHFGRLICLPQRC